MNVFDAPIRAAGFPATTRAHELPEWFSCAFAWSRRDEARVCAAFSSDPALQEGVVAARMLGGPDAERDFVRAVEDELLGGGS